jgi:hypothetical protein
VRGGSEVWWRWEAEDRKGKRKRKGGGEEGRGERVGSGSV